jgi:hypothetical protein
LTGSGGAVLYRNRRHDWTKERHGGKKEDAAVEPFCGGLFDAVDRRTGGAVDLSATSFEGMSRT